MTRTRRISHPAGSWAMQIEVPYPMGLDAGGQIFTRGQCDNDAAGLPRNIGDINAQIDNVVRFYREIWDDLAAPRGSLARLVAFYDRDAGLDAAHLCQRLIAAFDGQATPTIVPVPLAALSYPGMAIEIDYWGNRTATPDAFWLEGDSGGPPDAVRVGDHIYIGALRGGAEVEEKLRTVLAHFGADMSHLVKLTNFYHADLGPQEIHDFARQRAGWFGAAKPVVTDQPLADLGGTAGQHQIDALAVTEGDREDIWPNDLPAHPDSWDHPAATRIGDQLWTGAQLAWGQAGDVQAPGDLVVQTKIAMERIASLLDQAGFTFDDVVKVNTYYRGGADERALHDNMAVRNAYYRWPGPGSTGVPVEHHQRPDAMTSVEVTAIRDND